MRVLVIGGTRFIGPYVVRDLVEAGHEVTLFHRGRTEPDHCPLPGGLRRITGDRSGIASFADDIRDAAPDVVLDMIARSGDDAEKAVATVSGVANRYVIVSSMDVYRAYGILIGSEKGRPVSGAFTEEDPLRGELYPYRDRAADENDVNYWYDKIPAEWAVMRSKSLRGTVLRLPMVYGPGDMQHRLYPYFRRMDDGREAIPLSSPPATWRTARGYVEDVAAAIALAVMDDRAAGRIYNVAEEDALTEEAWARAVGDAAGWSGDLVPCTPDPEGNWDQHLVADTTLIRRELGWKERFSRDDALRRTVDWERANPPESGEPIDYDDDDRMIAEARSQTGDTDS